MCRSIHTLFNLAPAATADDVRAASLQFVRKISGYRQPSAANADAFERAVDEVARASNRLLASLTTTAPPRDHEHMVERARARGADRYGRA